jgi:hypothetical protein
MRGGYSKHLNALRQPPQSQHRPLSFSIIANTISSIFIMGRLGGGYIDLNARYGPNFRGAFNLLITNIKTLRVGALCHHCPDCKVKLVSESQRSSRITRLDTNTTTRLRQRSRVSGACILVLTGD